MIFSSFPKSFLTIVSVPLFLASCGNNSSQKIQNEADTIAAKVEAGMDNISNRIDTLINRNENIDQNFLTDFTELHTTQVHTLKQGIQKGGIEVKKEAAMLLADHKKLAKAFFSYLQKNNLSLKDVDTTNIVLKFADDEKGKDWDKRFQETLVDEQERLARLFEESKIEVVDSTLKAMIENQLPVLKKHLEKSQKLQEKLSAK